ncbi:MAG: outer membrane beta-barrel family protein [Porphyromonadaceae bacterium]|nr:outer membrane beta-barrel family protein [Porphyromonadaceae bacterium]
MISWCRALLLGLILGLSSNSIHAQHITGRVLDEKNRAIDQALVWITDSTDSTLLGQTYSDIQGRFTLPIQSKPSMLHIRSMGYISHTQHLLPSKSNIQLADIRLKDELGDLDALEVVAQKRLLMLSRRSGKLVLDVERSLDAQGSNALELVRKIPGMSVNEGSKTLRFSGRGNILVLMDGKQTRMQEAELIALLRSTPSSSIKNIELMTNPSILYDAEGSGAALNIVFRRRAHEGYNLSINTGAAYWYHLRQNLDASASWKRGKLSLWGRYSHDLGASGYWYGGVRLQEGLRYETHSTDTDRRGYASGAAGAEWQIGHRHRVLLELSTNLMSGPGDIQTYNYIADATTQVPLYSIYSESNYLAQRTNRYTVSSSYIYEPRDGYRLGLDLDYSRFSGASHIEQPNTFYSRHGAVDSMRKYESRGKRLFDLYGVSLTYEQPLLGGKLSSGAKYSAVTSNNGYRREQLETSEKYLLDTNASNDFDYDEYIGAAYLLYERALGDRWRVSGGIRLEHTTTHTHLHLLDIRSQRHSPTDRGYLDLFPSASLSYALGQMGALSLSIGRRIDRPQYANLNPIDEALDGLTSWRGNPFLKPQKMWRTELGWQYRQANLSASWSHTNDYFVSVLDTIAGGRTITTPMNLGTQRILNLSGNQGLELGRSWQLMLSTNVFWQENQLAYSPTRLFRLSRWGANATAQLSMPIVWGIRGEVLGSYHTRRLGGSTDISAATGRVDVGLQRSFLHDRLSIKLGLSDAFWSSHWNGINRNDAFSLEAYGHSESRLVSINVSYQLGGGKKHEHQRTSGIETEQSRL